MSKFYWIAWTFCECDQRLYFQLYLSVNTRYVSKRQKKHQTYRDKLSCACKLLIFVNKCYWHVQKHIIKVNTTLINCRQWYASVRTISLPHCDVCSECGGRWWVSQCSYIILRNHLLHYGIIVIYVACQGKST